MSGIDQPPRHRVMIVDDEESTRLLLARILTNDMDVEVILAGTCEQALRLGGSFAYDAILLDLMMPGIGGFGVLKELRANSPNAATPIIVVSVLSEPDTVSRCMTAGRQRLSRETCRAQFAHIDGEGADRRAQPAQNLIRTRDNPAWRIFASTTRKPLARRSASIPT